MSIDHILKTAFKDVLDEEGRVRDADVARKALQYYLEEEQGVQAELQRNVEQSKANELTLLSEIEKSKDPKAKKPPPPKKGEVVPSMSPTELLEQQLQQLLAQRQADIDEVARRPKPEEKFPNASYFSRFQKMSLDGNLKENFVETVQVINKKLVTSRVEGVALTDFLTEKRELAHDQEVEEEDKLKKQGIIVGQHVPALKSLLDLVEEELYSFGHFSSNLVLAGDLIKENRKNYLRRTGNLPISDLAESKLLARSKKKPVDATKPGYTLQTLSSFKREDRIRAQFSQTFAILESERSNKDNDYRSGIPRRIPKRDYGLSAIQVEKNRVILRGINHKLNYLRNPRNSDNYLNRMLVKSQETFQIYEETDGASLPQPHISDHHHDDVGGGSFSDKENVDNFASQGSRGHQNEESSHVTFKKKKHPSHNPLFVAVPSTVIFNGYEPDVEYTKTVHFKNISSVSRMVSVSGANTAYFKMAALVYPPNCSDGIIAPGLSVSTTVTFRPDKVSLYEDSIDVLTEAGSFKVPIKVTRDRPILAIPPVITANPGLVGDATRTAIYIKNTGGPGVFRLCKPGEYNPDKPSALLETEDVGCLRDPPFTIYPTQFDLDRDKSISINIEFIPLEINNFQEDYVIVDDNNQVFKFSIKGKSNEVSVAIQEINQVLFDSSNPRVKRDMYFSEANIGSEELQTISITNDTGSPISYEWVFVDSDCRNINKSANQKITDREADDLIFLRSNPNASLFGKKIDAIAMKSLTNEEQFVTIDAPHVKSNEVNVKSTTAPPASANRKSPRKTRAAASSSSSSSSAKGKLPAPGFISSGGSTGSGSGVGSKEGGLMDKNSINGGDNMFEATATSTLMRPNNISEAGFILTPARGVIPCDGLQTFKMSFHPTSVNKASLKAAFVIKDVPFAAVPDKKQKGYLEHLKSHGHGMNMRLKSWLDELGYSGSVEEYRKSNGSMSKTAKLNNLRNLLDLVSSQAASKVENSMSLLSLNKHVRELLVHVKMWKANELEIPEENNEVDDASIVTSKENDPTHHHQQQHHHQHETIVKVFPLHWKGSGGSFMTPTKVLPVTLHFDNDDDNENDINANVNASEESLLSPNGGGESVGQSLGGLHESSSSVLPLLTEDERKAFLANFNNGSNNNDNYSNDNFSPTNASSNKIKFDLSANEGVLINCLNEEEKQLLGEIWLDVDNAIKLLGPNLCSCLDALVKHEAVDYLRVSSLSNVASLSVDVAGVGQAQKLIVQPLHLFVPGDITIGIPFHTKMTVFNPSSSMIDIDAFVDEMVIDDYKAFPHSTHSAMNSADNIHLEVSPSRILVMPESRATFDITLVCNALGSFHLKVPLEASNIKNVSIDPLHISFSCCAPTIRYNCNEIDTGLIGCGFDASRTLTFTNESEAMVRYQIKCDLEENVHVGIAFDANGAKTKTSSRKGSPRPDSARSGGRESIKGSSRRSSEADTGALMASESSNLVPDQTMVFMSPPAGEVGPFETAAITVTTKAGKVPQRVRGLIECKVFDASGRILIDTKYLSYRGEVQSPEVKLYPMNFQLGTVYVGVPVTFQFTIENCRNLATRFKMERPGGPSSAFDITYDKPVAPLDAREKAVVTATFVGKSVGALDEVFASKVFGLMVPLGFTMKAVVKSINLEYTLLKEGSNLPKALSLEALMSQTELSPTEPLDIGSSVAIYQRKQIRFVVRNFSPISTPFKVSLKKFQAQGDSNTLLQELHCEGDSTAGRTDLVIVAQEDGENKFKSKPGKLYIGERELRKRDKRYLSSNLGASYLAEPNSGILPGWGVQVVTVYAFNSMPGCFNDNIEFEYFDNNMIKKSLIPLKMNVVGCPFIIDKNSLGLSPIAPGSPFPAQFHGNMVLNLGDGCVNCDPFTKEFVVRNNGNTSGLVKWRMSPVESTSKGLIKFSIDLSRFDNSTTHNSSHYDGKNNNNVKGAYKDVNKNSNKNSGDSSSSSSGKKEGRAKTIFKFWEDLYTPEFKVEPASKVIPPFGSQSFKVVMSNTETASKVTALMKANVTMVPSELDNKIISSASVCSFGSKGSNGSRKSLSRSSSSSALNFNLKLLLQADIVNPVLKIDKSVYQIESKDVIAPDNMSLKFKAKASLLFGHAEKDHHHHHHHHSNRGKASVGVMSSSSVSVHKQLTISNPLEAFLSFNVSTEGSFVLKNIVEVDHGNHLRSSSERSNRSKPLQVNSNSNSSGNGNNSTEMKRPGSERGVTKGVGGGSSLANSTELSSSGSIIGKFIRLNPHTSSSFIVEYLPRREVRDTLLSSILTDKAKETVETGNLVFSFSTGQTLRIPLQILINSPFLVASSPRLNLGTCHTSKSCSGLILLSNLTDVPAYWEISHVVTNKVISTSSIRVKGYEPTEEEVDDPDVFSFSPKSGSLEGPTVSTSTATAAPPHDLVRLPDSESIVPQRLSQTSWSTNILTMKDSLQSKFDGTSGNLRAPADAFFPAPVTITFKPKANRLYSCRFRVSCQYGNSFDILIQAKGTFEENLHAPTNPVPR